MVAGGASGGVTRFIVAPLDVIKIRFQVNLLLLVKPKNANFYLYKGAIYDNRPT